ncbi:MAG: tRNA uracil 4-sulfurtransferase ThiI [Candidatus Woesearchaeota archaeon]|jgi:thiamine biosynthesis protein ThiI|nr:tRNA uracil 4-sulfurtransferase ThiI [Candidatus Woesearchaeota archaeon]MDP7506665.1 tRNA uracil 4-sulfurtransferase ThiI [Candidatus Woesearchaeota archaeon]MDP7610611.1 tRNA uracil 4-sulfurtransferase ThiI [Candidatus Woesearchaeota archaeon]|tara:strand:+ start:4624 stop:5778 length:1155 start_codon:yes stop_codon:yes gene_type:complete
MIYDYIIIHYDEIGLKGKNRGSFEELLISNIEIKLKSLMKSCFRESGHITIEIDGKANISKIKEALSQIPGIAYFSLAKRVELNLDSLKKEAINFLEDKEYDSFKVNAVRHDKGFELNSMELNSKLGEVIIKALNKKVKMKSPDIMLKIELSKKSAYISNEDIKGVGGLPTNPQQKVVALLSGGFDSPVAAYLMMKRGCEVILVHFHNKNQASSSVESKITKLAEQLSKFQVKTKLYIVPFESLQKEIIMKVNSKLRMLVYRRFMLKIASEVAGMNKAKFLIVGDSLSQVASQTFENLEATYTGLDKHVLSPLIGLDKREIIEISKRIGTYEISAMPYGDCCSYFLAKHPTLKADVKLLEKNEALFDVDKLVEDVLSKSRVIGF